MTRLGLVAAIVLAACVAQAFAPVERIAADSGMFATDSESDRSAAAWYRIAALTVQVDAALEDLRVQHRCRPFGSTPPTDEQSLFASFAMHEALAAARLMWPHVLTLSPLLWEYYWPLRLRLGQIARAAPEERAELVCRTDFHQIRSRWNLALSGSMPGVEPPLEWTTVQRLGALSRLGAAYDRAVTTTCHSLDAPAAALTLHPAEVVVLRHSLAISTATLRSAPSPRPLERGSHLLWEGNQRAVTDWTADLLRSLEDGVRRHVCGHLLYHLLWGSYHTWLNHGYDRAEAMRLDQLLGWTQLEVGLRQICDFRASSASALAIYGISSLVSPVRTVVALPAQLRPQRDEIAVAVQEWLPDDVRVRSLQPGAPPCPAEYLQSLSSFLTDLAALPAGRPLNQ